MATKFRAELTITWSAYETTAKFLRQYGDKFSKLSGCAAVIAAIPRPKQANEH